MEDATSFLFSICHHHHSQLHPYPKNTKKLLKVQKKQMMKTKTKKKTNVTQQVADEEYFERTFVSKNVGSFLSKKNCRGRQLPGCGSSVVAGYVNVDVPAGC